MLLFLTRGTLLRVIGGSKDNGHGGFSERSKIPQQQAVETLSFRVKWGTIVWPGILLLREVDKNDSYRGS